MSSGNPPSTLRSRSEIRTASPRSRAGSNVRSLVGRAGVYDAVRITRAWPNRCMFSSAISKLFRSLRTVVFSRRQQVRELARQRPSTRRRIGAFDAERNRARRAEMREVLGVEDDRVALGVEPQRVRRRAKADQLWKRRRLVEHLRNVTIGRERRLDVGAPLGGQLLDFGGIAARDERERCDHGDATEHARFYDERGALFPRMAAGPAPFRDSICVRGRARDGG
jgi:hypothetical protein